MRVRLLLIMRRGGGNGRRHCRGQVGDRQPRRIWACRAESPRPPLTAGHVRVSVRADAAAKSAQRIVDHPVDDRPDLFLGASTMARRRATHARKGRLR